MLPVPEASCLRSSHSPALTDGNEPTHRHGLTLPSNVHAEHGKAALRAEECDPLHKSGDLF
jgi:hypothetical protein